MSKVACRMCDTNEKVAESWRQPYYALKVRRIVHGEPEEENRGYLCRVCRFQMELAIRAVGGMVGRDPEQEPGMPVLIVYQ